MRVGILSTRPDVYSTKRLFEAATARGHDVSIINYRRCALGLANGKAVVVHHGAPVELDVLIPRLGATSARFGAAVVRQLEAAGVPTTATAGAVLRARDKLASLQALVAAGVPVPATAAARESLGLSEVLSLVGSVPVVVKLLEGSAGSGVVLAETKKAAESLLAAFHQLDADFLVQEFVKEANGCDIRAFVIGGKVVAAMSRCAAAGDFRANLHQGGTSHAVKLTPQERRVAIQAAKALGLSVAGVDLLRSEHGPVVLEVNVSPGLQGIEGLTKIDVAERIVTFAERLVSGEAVHPSRSSRRIS